MTRTKADAKVRALGPTDVVLLHVRRVFSAVVGLVLGIQTAAAVFYAPVLIYGDDRILLLWGWIAPFIALPTAVLVGWLSRSIVRDLLPGNPTSAIVGWSRFAGVASATLVLLAGTSYAMFTHGDEDIRWSEEVALHDGTTVVVSRRVVGNSFGRPRAQPDSWLPSGFEIDASVVPSSANDATWRSPMRPVLFERAASAAAWILLAEPKDCKEWHDLNRPNPPYLAYELQGGTWSRTEVPRELLGRTPNLLVAPYFTGEPSTLNAAEVARRNSEHSGPEGLVTRAKSLC